MKQYCAVLLFLLMGASGAKAILSGSYVYRFTEVLMSQVIRMKAPIGSVPEEITRIVGRLAGSDEDRAITSESLQRAISYFMFGYGDSADASLSFCEEGNQSILPEIRQLFRNVTFYVDEPNFLDNMMTLTDLGHYNFNNFLSSITLYHLNNLSSYVVSCVPTNKLQNKQFRFDDFSLLFAERYKNLFGHNNETDTQKMVDFVLCHPEVFKEDSTSRPSIDGLFDQRTEGGARHSVYVDASKLNLLKTRIEEVSTGRLKVTAPDEDERVKRVLQLSNSTVPLRDNSRVLVSRWSWTTPAANCYESHATIKPRHKKSFFKRIFSFLKRKKRD